MAIFGKIRASREGTLIEMVPEAYLVRQRIALELSILGVVELDLIDIGKVVVCFFRNTKDSQRIDKHQQ